MLNIVFICIFVFSSFFLYICHKINIEIVKFQKQINNGINGGNNIISNINKSINGINKPLKGLKKTIDEANVPGLKSGMVPKRIIPEKLIPKVPTIPIKCLNIKPYPLQYIYNIIFNAPKECFDKGKNKDKDKNKDKNKGKNKGKK